MFRFRKFMMSQLEHQDKINHLTIEFEKKQLDINHASYKANTMQSDINKNVLLALQELNNLTNNLAERVAILEKRLEENSNVPKKEDCVDRMYIYGPN